MVAGSNHTGRQPYGDAEAAARAWGKAEGSVVSLRDALDDRQTKAESGMVGANPSAAALERFDQRGDQVRGEHFAGVLDSEYDGPRLDAGGHPDRAAVREVVDDRVVHEVRGQLQQQRARPDGGGKAPRGLD